VRRLVGEHRLDVSRIRGTGPDGRLTKGDVLLYIEQSEAKPRPRRRPPAAETVCAACESVKEEISRKPMTPIRRRIASGCSRPPEHGHADDLQRCRHERVIELRKRYKEAFQKKYGCRSASCPSHQGERRGLEGHPRDQCLHRRSDIIYHHYYHIGVAVGSERGLVVPVIRHADQLSFADIEKAIMDFVAKIKENRLGLNDLEAAPSPSPTAGCSARCSARPS